MRPAHRAPQRPACRDTGAVRRPLRAGRRHEAAGRYDSARDCYESAWEAAKHCNDPRLRARCCHALADLHRRVGDLHFAARFRQRALAAELEAGHAVRASSLASLAEDAARAAEWRLADQFSAAASAAPSNRARAQVSIVRALSCTAEGNSTSAVHHLRRALRLLYDHGDRARCADVLIMLACQYERRQNYRKAASTFHRAARTFRRLDNTPAARHAAQRRAVAHRSASILQHAAECN